MSLIESYEHADGFTDRLKDIASPLTSNSSKSATELHETDAFLKSFDQLIRANLEWDVDHLWDIKLRDIGSLIDPPTGNTKDFSATRGAPTVPGIFSTWLPVVDMEDIGAISNPEHHKIYNTNFSLNGPTDEPDIQITFIDTTNHTLYLFFKDWIEYCTGLKTNGRIPELDRCVKEINILKMTRQKKKVYQKSCYVIPAGSLTNSGKSTGDLSTYIVRLLVLTHPKYK